MAKEKELSSTDKRRRTTLRKKSVDELVNIVIRKDDIERKLSKSVETFKKLQDINDKRINTIQDSLNKSEEIQMSQEKTIAALNATLDIKYRNIAMLEDDNKALSGRIKVLDKTIADRTKELRVSFIVIIVLLMMLAASVIL
jgi:hypothetical protein